MTERKVTVVDGKGGGPMFRAIGTCDIDGNGTTFDLPDGQPFQCAGPFVLLVCMCARGRLSNFCSPTQLLTPT